MSYNHAIPHTLDPNWFNPPSPSLPCGQAGRAEYRIVHLPAGHRLGRWTVQGQVKQRDRRRSVLPGAPRGPCALPWFWKQYQGLLYTFSFFLLLSSFIETKPEFMMFYIETKTDSDVRVQYLRLGGLVTKSLTGIQLKKVSHPASDGRIIIIFLFSVFLRVFPFPVPLLAISLQS